MPKKKHKPDPHLFPVNISYDRAMTILNATRASYPDFKIHVSEDLACYRVEDPLGKTWFIDASIFSYGILIEPNYCCLLVAHCQEWITDHIGMPKNGWTNGKDRSPVPLEFKLD